MESYGVYTRTSDTHIWQLETITNREAASLAQEINAQFGVYTLVVGPFTVFPKFLES